MRINPARRKDNSFTLVEIMLVMVILASLVNFVFAGALRSRREAESAVCAEQRRIIQDAETAYFINEANHSEALLTLVNTGYLAHLPECPGGGVYAWQAYPANDSRYKTALGCSLHSASVVKEIPLENITPAENVTPSQEPIPQEEAKPKKDKKKKDGRK